jgi:hypothetical protein
MNTLNAVRFLIAKSRSVRGAFVERPDERHAHKVDAHEVDAHEMGACGGLGEMDAHGMGAYDRAPRVTACAADGTARREVEASGWPDRKSQVRDRLPLTARFQFFMIDGAAASPAAPTNHQSPKPPNAGSDMWSDIDRKSSSVSEDPGLRSAFKVYKDR